MKRLLGLSLSHFRWFRKMLGGRWERWWVDSPVNDTMWHWREDWEDMSERPTCICRGTPIIEDYRFEAKVVKDRQ